VTVTYMFIMNLRFTPFYYSPLSLLLPVSLFAVEGTEN
jgi:hypothetical protein